MKLREAPFSQYYRRFCVFMLQDSFRDSLQDFPGFAEAGGVLTYAYVDPEAGLTFEVMAMAARQDTGFLFAGTNPDVRVMLRADSVTEADCFFFADSDGSLFGRYRDKIVALKGYLAPEEKEATRHLQYPDRFRDLLFPDRVHIVLKQDGKNTEDSMAELLAANDAVLIGELLREPEQPFGFHEKEAVTLVPCLSETGEACLLANLNPDKWLTREELKDGTLLKAGIAAFKKEESEENFFELMLLLRDSSVLLPCLTELGEEDKKQMAAAVKKAGGDPEKLLGQTFSNLGPIRLIPDTLEREKKTYLPVFTAREETGSYGEHLFMVEKPFTDAVALARFHKKKVSGIVINPFTDPYVLPVSLYTTVEESRSRIRETAAD